VSVGGNLLRGVAFTCATWILSGICLAAPEGLADRLAVKVAVAEAQVRPAERWSGPLRDGEITYRLARKGLNCYLPVPKFWRDGRSPEGLWLLKIRFKDTITEPVHLRCYNGRGGTWGHHCAAAFGGKGDGAWKTARIVVPGRLFGVLPDSDPPATQLWFASAAGDLPVASVEVWSIRADRQAAARLQYYREVEQRRWRLASRMPRLPFAETTPLEPVSPEHRRLGFIPFVRSYTEVVYPNTVPKQNERITTIALYVTPGEAEPALFGVRSLGRPLKGVSVRLLQPVGGGTALPAEWVQIGVVEFAPIRWGRGSAAKSWRVRPVRIWPWERFPGCKYFEVSDTGERTIPANTTAAFWLTVRPPEDARAGLYRGRVRFASQSGSVDFDLQVQVLPFRLVRNDRWWIGMYIKGIASDVEIADLASHGVNATSQWPNGYRIENRGGRAIVEFVGEDDYMRRLQAAGITGPHVWFQGNDRRHALDEKIAAVMGVKLDTPEFYKHYVDVVRQFHEHAWQAGWNRLIWCIFDEPSKGGRAQRRWLGDARAIRESLGKQVTLFCVMMNRGPAKAQEFLPYPDIWSCNGRIAEMVAFAARYGGEVWSYGGCSHRVDPADARWSYGFNVWRSGVKGHYAWAYNWSADDPLNDLDAGHMDWNVSFFDTDGSLIPSPAWEAYREGTDDLRYLLTAMRLLEEKPGHPRAAWARSELQKIKARLTGTEAAPDKTGIDVLGKEFVPTDRSAMSWARSRLVRIILALSR